MLTVEDTEDWGDQRKVVLETRCPANQPYILSTRHLWFLPTPPSSHSDRFSFLGELALTPGSIGGYVAQCGHPEHSICPSVWVSDGCGTPVRGILGMVQEVPDKRCSLLGGSYNLALLRLSSAPQWKGLRLMLTFHSEAEKLMPHIIT